LKPGDSARPKRSLTNKKARRFINARGLKKKEKRSIAGKDGWGLPGWHEGWLIRRGGNKIIIWNVRPVGTEGRGETRSLISNRGARTDLRWRGEEGRIERSIRDRVGRRQTDNLKEGESQTKSRRSACEEAEQGRVLTIISARKPGEKELNLLEA